MSKINEQIVLSTPQTMRDRYPDAGWASINGTLPDTMEDYPEVILPAEISKIVREIITKVEAAIQSDEVTLKQHQKIRNLRSISFEIPIEVPLDQLGGGRRGRIPRPGRQEIIELYKRAGWHSVDITNQTWITREGIRKLVLRLTYWQTLPTEAEIRSAVA